MNTNDISVGGERLPSGAMDDVRRLETDPEKETSALEFISFNVCAKFLAKNRQTD